MSGLVEESVREVRVMDGFERCDGEDVAMSVERLDWARALMRNQVERGRAPSVAAIVARHGKVVFAEAFGVRGPGGDPLLLDDVWPIASAGKPLTAAVLMTLVEEGRVGLLDPVVDHISELVGTGNDGVLIHHLLTHTAGWESALRTHRLDDVLASGALPPPPPGRDLLTHIFLSLALDPVKVAEPGVQMDYDNSPYALLAEIVRRITGGTLDAAMRERIFEPLGMIRSTVIVGESLRPALVTRAPGLPFGPDQPVSFEGEIWESSDSGSAGIHMSPTDLAVFGQAILEGGIHNGIRILAPSTVRSMVTNQIPGVPALFGDLILREGSWGYGFTVIGEERFPFFGGGLVPPGSVMHPGAGGISYWIDFEHELVGVFFEVITEMTEFLEPVSGMAHRFQDIITGAVLR